MCVGRLGPILELIETENIRIWETTSPWPITMAIALAVVSCSCKRGLYYYEAQAGLELLVLLPQPPEYWNCKHVLSPLPG